MKIKRKRKKVEAIYMERLQDLWNDVIDEAAKTKLAALCVEKANLDMELELEGIFEKFYKGQDYSAAFKNVRKNYFLKTKRRWVESAVKNYRENKAKTPKELEQEYRYLTFMMERYGSISSATEQEGSSATTPGELVDEIALSLRDWAMEEDALITSYRYIEDKLPKQLAQACRYDLAYIMGKLLIVPDQPKPKRLIIDSPHYAAEVPFFTALRRRLLDITDESIEYEGTQYLKYPYFQSGYDVLIEKKYLDMSGNEQRLADLDRLDFKVFVEIMQLRDLRFTSEKVIEVDIGELVKTLYPSDKSHKNYEIVENRIWKMKYFSMTKIVENKRIAFGIFDYVELTEHPDGKKTAEIQVNEEIYRNYIGRQTIGMYAEQFEKLKLGMAQQLLFVLQKERLACHTRKQPYKFELTYRFCGLRIRLTKRRKAENVQDIQDALEELQAQKALVSSFKRKGDNFLIDFYPLSKEEVEDFIIGKYTDMPLLKDAPHLVGTP